MGLGAARTFINPPAVRNILIGGDSLSVVPGFPAGPGYPGYLQALMPTATITVNAVAGRKTFDLYGAMHAQIIAGGWTDVVILIGVNDFSQGYTVEQALVCLELLYQDVWASRARMVGVELTPWSSFGGITPLKQAYSEDFNTRLHKHVIPWSVVNTHSLGDPAWALLPANDCGDGVHLSLTGQEALAQLIYNRLQ